MYWLPLKPMSDIDWPWQELEYTQQRQEMCGILGATAGKSLSGLQASSLMPVGSQELGASVGDDAALAVPEAGAEEGSEDEAPEELSLAGGKLAAEKQVQEEKKERAEGRKTTKQKRRRSAASGDDPTLAVNASCLPGVGVALRCRP